MNKSIIYFVVLIIFVVIGIVGLILLNQNNQSSQQSENNNSSINQTSNSINNNPISNQSEIAGEQVFSMEEVENADNIDRKCLVVYENNVYEIPASWKNQHPGGSSEIIESCGRDITRDFNLNHSGSTATRQLESFKVGVLE